MRGIKEDDGSVVDSVDTVQKGGMGVLRNSICEMDTSVTNLYLVFSLPKCGLYTSTGFRTSMLGIF